MLRHARIIETLCLGLPLKDVGWVCIVREGPYCSAVKCILLLRCVNKAQPTSKSISGSRKVMRQRVERQWSEMYRTVPGASWPFMSTRVGEAVTPLKMSVFTVVLELLYEVQLRKRSNHLPSRLSEHGSFTLTAKPISDIARLARCSQWPYYVSGIIRRSYTAYRVRPSHLLFPAKSKHFQPAGWAFSQTNRPQIDCIDSEEIPARARQRPCFSIQAQEGYTVAIWQLWLTDRLQSRGKVSLDCWNIVSWRHKTSISQPLRILHR